MFIIFIFINIIDNLLSAIILYNEKVEVPYL